MSITSVLLSSLVARDTCRYIQAKSGDGCYSLSQRCGISQTAFTNFNPSPFSCNAIKVDDYVCCSAGSLPDFSPKKQANGHCASYAIKAGDTCYSIASAHKIKDWHVLEFYNQLTWGWAGCSSVKAGQKICLSDGTPPFPASVAKTICGPQVPGTKQPQGMSPRDWAKLNPCPLNSCCDVWGQCGTTKDFCTATPASSGAPGTAKPGTNGCISNCGSSIINNGRKPDSLKHIGYFEAWNADRPCLNLDLSEIDTSRYTHIHFAFATLSNDWVPSVTGAAAAQFAEFRRMNGAKKILSFGGWAFSTDPATYNIFRTGVMPANRQIFANNVVEFVKSNGLDGVDFDWEYPGAQDIPGIPADSLYSGPNYLEFLKLVRAQLYHDQSLSIAAPASYWYLKGFPIQQISTITDYIVYMTYDLHGQWDYGNNYVDPGCPGGNCLRHQVNETEVNNALAMVTKAGVPAYQVVVGMPLYGRSFKMTTPGYTFPQCKYVGPKSAAAPGQCTQTAGYISNAEIIGIIDDAKQTGKKILQYYDQGDILVYNETEWVSWMTSTTYAVRQAFTNSKNFGGVSDWAIDLNITDTDSSDIDPDVDDFEPLCDYTLTFANLDALFAARDQYHIECLNAYTMQVLMTMLDSAYANYTDVNNGYDEMFGYYVTYIKKLVPAITSQGFMYNHSNGGYNNPGAIGIGMDFFDCHLGDGTTIPCTDIDKGDNPGIAGHRTTELTLRDPEGYTAGLANVGLDPSWVTFGDYAFDWTQRGAHPIFNHYAFTGSPVGNDSMVVPNPKDIVTKGIASIPDLQTAMTATYLDIILGQWMGGSTSDPVQAYSVPVFMLLQGIDGMQQAKTLGQQEQKEEEEEEKRKKDFILLIISMVLMIVPIIGQEIAVAAGFATLARTIFIAGEAGNAALGIYDSVENPKSAIINVIGMLFGVSGIASVTRDAKGIADVARIRRGLGGDTIAAIGKLFEDNDQTLQAINKVCKAS